MIRFAKEKDREDIIRLWHSVFGDDKTSINNYLDKYLDCVLLYITDDKIIGMLSLLPLQYKGVAGKYVYAVATEPSFRGRGVATELIQYCYGENFLLLVPAEKSLFNYYERLGFKAICSFERKEYFSTELILSDDMPEKITAQELYKLRKSSFNQFDFFEWSEKELQTVSDMYNGHIYKGKDFFAVCDVRETEVFVKELYAKDNFKAVCALNSILKKEKYVILFKNDNGHPFAMIKGMIPLEPYFNLAMD